MSVPEENPLTTEKIEQGDSRYDRSIYDGRDALSTEKAAGLQLSAARANCTTCHVGPNFTDEKLHNTGVAWRWPRG